MEISLADMDFFAFGEELIEHALMVRELCDVEYTVHAPYQNSPVEHARVSLSEKKNRNQKSMGRVLEVSSKIGAECVVVHAGDVLNSRSLANAIENLKVICDIAAEYDISVAVENVFTDGNGVRRVGETPGGLLHICEGTARENLGVNIDVGHAFISSLMHNITIEDYFELLEEYIMHLHIHNNHGLLHNPWDEHLPIFSGLIDYRALRRFLKARNVILEVKRGRMEEIPASLDFLRGRAERLQVNLPPV